MTIAISPLNSPDPIVPIIQDYPDRYYFPTTFLLVNTSRLPIDISLSKSASYQKITTCTRVTARARSRSNRLWTLFKRAPFIFSHARYISRPAIVSTPFPQPFSTLPVHRLVRHATLPYTELRINENRKSRTYVITITITPTTESNIFRI